MEHLERSGKNMQQQNLNNNLRYYSYLGNLANVKKYVEDGAEINSLGWGFDPTPWLLRWTAEHQGHTATTQILKAWQENQSKELVQKIDQMFEASQNQFTQLFEASQNQFTQLFKFQRESMTKLILQLQQATAEQQQIEILTREKSTLQQQVSAGERQIEILTREKSELQKQASAGKQQIEILAGEKSELQKQLGSLQDETQRMTIEMEQLRKELSSLAEETQQKTSEIKQLQEEKAELESKPVVEGLSYVLEKQNIRHMNEDQLADLEVFLVHSTSKVQVIRNELRATQDLCCVCMERKKSVVFLPCRHQCTCEECSDQLLTSINKCPMCTWEITQRVVPFK